MKLRVPSLPEHRAVAGEHKENGAPRSRFKRVVLVLLTVLGASAVLPARADMDIYGFGQADWIQDSKRVNPQWMDAFRPSRIANPEGEFGPNGQSDISVKQSRFGVKGTQSTGDHTPPLSYKFEFDMFGVGVDAGQTTIRLRHAYGEWGPLLAGQTHSLFMDIDVFPDVIDYWGPCGMVFYRLPQIRWIAFRSTSTYIAFALEKPGNDIDPGNIRELEGFNEANIQGNETTPDLTGQYRYDAEWGHAQLAGILRNVGFEYQITPTSPFQKGHEVGWGLDLSGTYNGLAMFNKTGKDKVLASIVYGHGIASYMNDGGMDLAPTATFISGAPIPSLAGEAVPLLGVMLYYNHYWTPQWESSFGYALTQVTNTNFQSAGTFHKGQYASGNLLWYPADNVMWGAELLWGQLTVNTQTVGIDWRFQFTAKYLFSAKVR